MRFNSVMVSTKEIILHCNVMEITLTYYVLKIDVAFAKETMKGRGRKGVKNHSVTLCGRNIKCAME